MTLPEAMTELVIAARERAEEDPVLAEACSIIEAKTQRLLAVRIRRSRRHLTTCLCCDHPTSSGLLCRLCLADAPPDIQHAFRLADGLDGIRAAADRVRAYARGGAIRRIAA